MQRGSDTDALVEVATQAVGAREYELGVLDILRRRLGFDVAMFKRRESSDGLHGIDPRVELAVRSLWGRFRAESQSITLEALRQRGVAVDVEVLGMRRLERLLYYQTLMKPHHGTSTAFIVLARGGQLLTQLCLGRTHGGFTDDELDYLRSIKPALSVCEAALLSAPQPTDRSVLAQLTPREREVLSHLPLGHTNAQIALALGTAERTVRNQLSSIYEKLGVSTRAEAVADVLSKRVRLGEF
ncbi:MAG TPA: helix-turn-helix transcriptional regulator [Polyangiales bacterium]|nr:helix-turn-helix transcriptional regulator [Polyangiales bacterium]